jgi:hypothetical protein
MINDQHDLLLELWARIKSYIPAKERLEAADTLIAVFDEFGFIENSLLDEDLDKELTAAAKSHLSNSYDEEDNDWND